MIRSEFRMPFLGQLTFVLLVKLEAQFGIKWIKQLQLSVGFVTKITGSHVYGEFT